MTLIMRKEANNEELSPIANGDELDPEVFPELYNLSSAFLFNLLPHPIQRAQPEYVYLDVPIFRKRGDESEAEFLVKMHQWNFAWEASQLRYDMFENELPKKLQWLERFRDQNIYLLPRTSFHHYEAYVPLYHLLHRKTLERFSLPTLKKGIWPPPIPLGDHENVIPRDFDSLLSAAFAQHIWPLLVSQSGLSAFSTSDPIRVLAHNLDFWLPYIQGVAEDRLGQFGRVKPEADEVAERLKKVREGLPPEIGADTPHMGGPIWMGEEDAWEATVEMFEKADAGGRLRSIIDAVRSNRVEDDFSGLWSYAKEDFERKAYRKRSKIKVTFIELDDTVPVHGPDSEVHETLLWEDFMAVINKKERRIVVLLRNGITKIAEIGELLGYANHSPVSKALKRIRLKALKFLEG